MLIAPRTVRSRSGNSSRATSLAEYTLAPGLADRDAEHRRCERLGREHLAHEVLGLAPVRAVADRDARTACFLHKLAQRLLRAARARRRPAPGR